LNLEEEGETRGRKEERSKEGEEVRLANAEFEEGQSVRRKEEIVD
jgi:hypothetical protein